jgi:uncharacterized membrane protein YqiK
MTDLFMLITLLVIGAVVATVVFVALLAMWSASND